MAKSRLWVAGDSFGIFDKDDTRPHWIRLVADQLGVDEVKNYARGGADNDMIYFVADAIIKENHWPGRNEINFDKKTDYMIYLSTTNTRGWFREDIFDNRPFDSHNSIANFNWWMQESNGKLVDEYEHFPKPVVHSQNYNSLLHEREEHKKLSGNNKDLVNHGDPIHLKADQSRVSPEVLDIMANYILLQDVDLSRKLNQIRMEHMMTWASEQKIRIFFSHHDFTPLDEFDAVRKQEVDSNKKSLDLGMFEHPTDFEDVDGDGKNEQPNHLTDQAHLDYYYNYLEKRVDDIINTWSRSQ